MKMLKMLKMACNVKNSLHGVFALQTTENLKLHQPGIEPGAPAWQAEILPLNH